MSATRCQPIDGESFAPFGLVLHRPTPGAPRVDLIEELHNTRATAKPRHTLASAPPYALPLVATKMERHVHSSQTFTPLDCEAYLVLVAPKGPDGLPDVKGLRAFRVPGDVGIHYFADTWHHPLTPLAKPATFAILTFIDGGPTDEEWFNLPTSVDIVA